MIILFTTCCLVASTPTLAQEAQRTLTNADILNLTKSGIGEQTIILMIQKASPKFDTSPEALIELKKGGVPIERVSVIGCETIAPDRLAFGKEFVKRSAIPRLSNLR
jgi:hypothetical protein